MTVNVVVVFFAQTGQQQVLSQQMLIDCSWGFGNNGCDGGEEWRGYEWIMKHGGIATTETYGAYMGMVSPRRDVSVTRCCSIGSFSRKKPFIPVVGFIMKDDFGLVFISFSFTRTHTF